MDNKEKIEKIFKKSRFPTTEIEVDLFKIRVTFKYKSKKYVARLSVIGDEINLVMVEEIRNNSMISSRSALNVERRINRRIETNQLKAKLAEK
jgi:hypothetical protein